MYRVFYLDHTPISTQGDIGDISNFQDTYYIRFEDGWEPSLTDLNKKNRPKQIHPFLRAERRFDAKSTTWKSQSHWNNKAVQKSIENKNRAFSPEFKDGGPVKRKNEDRSDREEALNKIRKVNIELSMKNTEFFDSGSTSRFFSSACCS